MSNAIHHSGSLLTNLTIKSRDLKRRIRKLSEFNPDRHPREPAGSSTGGEFSSTNAVAGIQTGRSATLTLYRGTGLSEKEKQKSRIPSQFGRGEYWSPLKEHAASYGPNVKAEAVTMKNPFVVDLPQSGRWWVPLRKGFGTLDPEKITKDLLSKGHDYLVVRNVSVLRQDFQGISSEIIKLGGV